MAPWGGRKKAVGTNPWSWAAPAGGRPPMVLDIANTGVARGKIYLARQSIAAFQPVAEFGERMERYIAELKSVPLAQGFDEIVYPGELEARNDARNRAEGLLLPDDTRADLQKLAKACSLQSKLPF
jgi:LDH2 family malate/lactate/ureidoglycolate dehydrogenase